MNVLLISIDSLSRRFLGACGPSIDLDVDTENLDRFAERAASFETHYAGSLPCMPARREWLAGVQEFLWRPWGPMEPFDQPLPRLARDNGTVSQLITDHYHYFQHGSGGYYEDFNGFEFVRGHEFDAHETSPREPPERLLAQSTDPGEGDSTDLKFMNRAQYARNVANYDEDDESEFFAPRVFSSAAEWVRENREWPQWFCYVDSFDVHEPFHCPEPYASMYTDEDPQDPELTNWPFYGRVDRGRAELTERELEFVRSQFAGKVTMVDRWFGHLLDALDDVGAWDDTAVIVTADHGHYLGEHGWIGKPEAPLYDVLAHTPLFVWHPDSPRMGDRIDALTAAVDLYPTVLDLLGIDVPGETHGHSLGPLLDGRDETHRDWALYGYWGSSVNVTDGRFTYHRPCDESVDVTCHSTRMMNPYGWFTPNEPQHDAESGSFLPYTDSPVWRYEAPSYSRHDGPLLFDTEEDPEQTTNLAGERPDVEERMRSLLVRALDELSAPDRQYDRLALSGVRD